jgi:hypothetical protein
MKISEFKELEQKINGQDFHQNYKLINIVMVSLSYFGHLASIFLAYFFLSRILAGAMGNPIVVFLSSVIILSALELIKRNLFDKFSIAYLKVRSFGKDVMPLLLLSCLIISMSFYSSISGAKEFSSKSKELETDRKEIMTHYKDSMSLVYNDKIKSSESEIKSIKGKVEIKDKEQTELENTNPLTWQQRNRIKDLKSEKTLLRTDITKLESDIGGIKKELETTIKSKDDELSQDTSEKKDDNSKNSLFFVIISTIIELIILAGVYFGQYYKFRSYKEFKDKIERDPNYQKWALYNSILETIYGVDNKINDKLSSNKNIIDMCKLNDIVALPRDVDDFMKLASNLNILKSSGSARYISKQRDIAFEILKSHFNIV